VTTFPTRPPLEMLLAVAHTGSLNAASRELGITQQAVSARVRSAEAQAGVALIARTARGSTLTPEGRVVAEGPARLLAVAGELDAGLAAFRAGHRTRLRVSASLTIAEQLLPGWLVSLQADARHRRQPALEIVLTAANSDTVTRQVRAGQADLGFVEGPASPKGLRSRVIGHDGLVMIVRRDHSYGVWQHQDYQRLTGRLCEAFGHAADSAAGQAVAAGQGALFDALLLYMDAGRDQQISRDEFTAALGRGIQDRPGFDTAVRAAARTLVQVADQDGSGALDTGEYARLAAVYGARADEAARAFGRIDQDRNGVPDSAELALAISRFLHQPGPRRLRQPRRRPPVTAPPARVQAWSLVTGTRPGPPWREGACAAGCPPGLRDFAAGGPLALCAAKPAALGLGQLPEETCRW
jgi:DNA-binding transcriptional LysR family regulator